VQFIERNKDKPFFLYLSHYAPHTILNGRPDLVAKYRKKHAPGKSTRDRCYLCKDSGHKGDALNHWAGDHNPHLAAMLESIDDGLGLIIAKLNALGLDENTIIIFTSDNGGETNVTSNAPLRGGKSQLYEGGIRVPLIIRWPGETPAGKVSSQPTANVDFYPTLLKAIGVAPDKKQTLDGVSMLNTWRDPEAAPKRAAMYWHYPLEKPHFLGGRSGGAIRSGSWKLIEFFDTNKVELFHLDSDPSEKTNLAAQRPNKRHELHTQLIRWRKSVGATKAAPKR
jgi:arylsulfatase A-like enzyme